MIQWIWRRLCRRRHRTLYLTFKEPLYGSTTQSHKVDSDIFVQVTQGEKGLDVYVRGRFPGRTSLNGTFWGVESVTLGEPWG